MTSTADLPLFLTITEAATTLRVHRRTIENRIKAGKLPAKRLVGGQTILIDRRDVPAQLEEVPAPPASSPGLLPPGTSPAVAETASPLIDRLSTPDGRACAFAAVCALRDAPADSPDDKWDLAQALADHPLAFHGISADSSEAG